MDLLTAAAREQGTTVVLVTHDARVAAYADREVIVRDGKVSSLARPGRRVIRLGLRLAVSGGREAVGPAGHHRHRGGDRRRPAADAAGRHQRRQRAERPVRLAGHRGTRPARAASSGGAATGRDPLWWLLRADYFDGQAIGRVDVAATGPDSPVPPGIPRSRRRASSTPRRRWPRCCATPRPRSSATAIPAPGRHHRRGRPASPGLADHRRRPHRRAAVRHRPAPREVTGISTTPPSSCRQRLRVGVGINAERHRPDPVGGRRGAAVPGADLHRRRPPGCPPPAASSGSPRCAWSARRPGRSR